MSSSSPAKSELHAELQRLRNEIGAKYPLNKLNTSKMNNADVLKMARISELQSELGTNVPLLSANSTGAESAASVNGAAPVSVAAASANAASVNAASLPSANAAASLPSVNGSNAALVAPANTSQPKTTTVKKYKVGDQIIFDDKVRQFMITPEPNPKPGQKTVNYELISADITALKDCYVSTIQPAKTEGGKTAKSKKSKKRNTHKKK